MRPNPERATSAKPEYSLKQKTAHFFGGLLTVLSLLPLFVLQVINALLELLTKIVEGLLFSIGYIFGFLIGTGTTTKFAAHFQAIILSPWRLIFSSYCKFYTKAANSNYVRAIAAIPTFFISMFHFGYLKAKASHQTPYSAGADKLACWVKRDLSPVTKVLTNVSACDSDDDTDVSHKETLYQAMTVAKTPSQLFVHGLLIIPRMPLLVLKALAEIFEFTKIRENDHSPIKIFLMLVIVIISAVLTILPAIAATLANKKAFWGNWDKCNKICAGFLSKIPSATCSFLVSIIEQAATPALDTALRVFFFPLYTIAWLVTLFAKECGIASTEQWLGSIINPKKYAMGAEAHAPVAALATKYVQGYDAKAAPSDQPSTPSATKQATSPTAAPERQYNPFQKDLMRFRQRLTSLWTTIKQRLSTLNTVRDGLLIAISTVICAPFNVVNFLAGQIKNEFDDTTSTIVRAILETVGTVLGILPAFVAAVFKLNSQASATTPSSMSEEESPAGPTFSKRYSTALESFQTKLTTSIFNVLQAARKLVYAPFKAISDPFFEKIHQFCLSLTSQKTDKTPQQHVLDMLTSITRIPFLLLKTVMKSLKNLLTLAQATLNLVGRVIGLIPALIPLGGDTYAQRLNNFTKWLTDIILTLPREVVTIINKAYNEIRPKKTDEKISTHPLIAWTLRLVFLPVYVIGYIVALGDTKKIQKAELGQDAHYSKASVPEESLSHHITMLPISRDSAHADEIKIQPTIKRNAAYCSGMLLASLANLPRLLIATVNTVFAKTTWLAGKVLQGVGMLLASPFVAFTKKDQDKSDKGYWETLEATGNQFQDILLSPVRYLLHLYIITTDFIFRSPKPGTTPDLGYPAPGYLLSKLIHAPFYQLFGRGDEAIAEMRAVNAAEGRLKNPKYAAGSQAVKDFVQNNAALLSEADNATQRLSVALYHVARLPLWLAIGALKLIENTLRAVEYLILGASYLLCLLPAFFSVNDGECYQSRLTIAAEALTNALMVIPRSIVLFLAMAMNEILPNTTGKANPILTWSLRIIFLPITIIAFIVNRGILDQQNSAETSANKALYRTNNRLVKQLKTTLTEAVKVKSKSRILDKEFALPGISNDSTKPDKKAFLPQLCGHILYGLANLPILLIATLNTIIEAVTWLTGTILRVIGWLVCTPFVPFNRKYFYNVNKMAKRLQKHMLSPWRYVLNLYASTYNAVSHKKTSSPPTRVRPFYALGRLVRTTLNSPFLLFRLLHNAFKGPNHNYAQGADDNKKFIRTSAPTYKSATDNLTNSLIFISRLPLALCQLTFTLLSNLFTALGRLIYGISRILVFIIPKLNGDKTAKLIQRALLWIPQFVLASLIWLFNRLCYKNSGNPRCLLKGFVRLVFLPLYIISFIVNRGNYAKITKQESDIDQRTFEGNNGLVDTLTQDLSFDVSPPNKAVQIKLTDDKGNGEGIGPSGGSRSGTGHAIPATLAASLSEPAVANMTLLSRPLPPIPQGQL